MEENEENKAFKEHWNVKLENVDGTRIVIVFGEEPNIYPGDSFTLELKSEQAKLVK